MFNVAFIAQDLIHFRAPFRSSPELDVTTTKGLRLPHAVIIAVGVVGFLIAVNYKIPA